jgi:hypothetical protein
MNETFRAGFNFSQCQQSYSLPSTDTNLVLICISNYTSEISSFSYDKKTRKVTRTNVIELPLTHFLGSVMDIEERQLILFTKSFADDNGTDNEMVVHIFAVPNSVIWIGNTTVDDDSQMQINDAKLISYNTHSRRGVLISSVKFDSVLNKTY